MVGEVADMKSVKLVDTSFLTEPKKDLKPANGLGG